METIYDRLSESFKRARFPERGRPLCNNTRLYRRADDVLAVTLYLTDVVTLWADGKVALNTDGWRTVTTKDRISSFAPVRISSVKGTWYVSHDKARKRAAAQARREAGLPMTGDLWDVVPDDYDFRALYRREAALCEVPYFDGIMFDAEGNVLNGIDPDTWQRYTAMKADRDKLIQGYCTGFFRALAKGMDAPGDGDCWFCSMRTENGMSLGDESGNVDHLLSHIEERYYVPSLAFNALKEAGYKDIGVAIYLGYDPDTGKIGGPLWRSRQVGMGGGMVRRNLANYLRRRLIPDPPSEHNGFKFDGETLPLIAQHRAQRMAGR